MKNPYEAIGIKPTATQDEIKAAYRKLAKKHHPDLNPGNKSNEDRFKEITAAYELIGSPEQRAKFDSGELNEGGAQEQQFRQRSSRGPFYSRTQAGDQARYSRSFEGMDDDFLSSLFGAGAGAQRARNFAFPGEDQSFQMEVDFTDSILGAEKKFTLPNAKTLQTKIPPGIMTGQKLRFQGQGSAGSGGGAAGDLYLEIVVRPSELYRRNDKNIESSLPVSIAQALLGGEVPVQTVHGNVMLKVPPHSNTGTKLRIRGKGVLASKENPGDHIVELKIMLPEQADPELENFIKEWSSRHAK